MMLIREFIYGWGHVAGRLANVCEVFLFKEGSIGMNEFEV